MSPLGNTVAIVSTVSSPSMRERYREHVRTAVVEAAHDLIADRGWERVRMGEIAEAVGISRALLYKEFGDKPGLGEAVVLRTEPRGVVGFEVILSAYTSLLSMAATGSVSLVS